MTGRWSGSCWANRWRMASFRVDEIAAATGGKPVSGRGATSASGVSTDSRTLRGGDLFVAIRGPRFDGHDFVETAFAHGAAAAVVGRWPLPGVFASRDVWRVEDTLNALGNLARFHRQRFNLPLVAITGSSGKTTTKTMVAQILSGGAEVLAAVGTENNLIGVSWTLLRLEPSHRFAVIEMGTNRRGEIRRLSEIARPTVGVVTNIGPAHLETFGDLRGVLREKRALWEMMGSDGRLLLNADDPLLVEAGRRLSRRVTWFGTDAAADVRAEKIRLEPWGSVCRVDGVELKLPLPGRHNLLNALAALGCARLLGIEMLEAAHRLSVMAPLPGRLAQVEVDGCLVIDDTYNANPASFQAALQVLQGIHRPGRKILVAGDMLELGVQSEALHAEAGRWAAAAGLDWLVTVGALGRGLLAAAMKAGFALEHGRAFDTAEQAGKFLIAQIRPGDTVLLKGSRGMHMERILEIRCSTISSIH